MNATQTDMTVAQTILTQLGGRMFIVMTGSKNFLGSEKSLTMKIGSNGKRVTHVIVTLTPADTYDMEFLRVRSTKNGITRDLVKSVCGVYCDQLQDEFAAATGLYTRL